MKYLHEDGTPFTKEEFLQKLKTDKEFNNEFGNKGIDQIQNLINDIKTNPDSRRLMVNAYNIGELDQMVLPPCHYGFQVYTRELSLDERLKLWDNKFGFANEEQKNQFDPNVHLDTHGVPTKLITITYNNETIESYE